ncbi:MAG: hypothetical protein MI921_11435 [Cytophagales bacterium]|nr:hypothetical protein [Cytophagales bacterium]
MIKPDKHTDPKLTAIYVAGLIVKELKLAGTSRYDELLDKTVLLLGNKAKQLFIPATSLLFLIDKIEYIRDSDSFSLKSS